MMYGGSPSTVVHCAVECTRSLFDLGHLSCVHCYTQRHVIQSEHVMVACECSLPGAPGSPRVPHECSQRGNRKQKSLTEWSAFH